MRPYLPFLFRPGRRDTARVSVKIAGKELVAHFDYDLDTMNRYFVPRCTGLFYSHGRALPTPKWLRKALSDQYAKLEDR